MIQEIFQNFGVGFNPKVLEKCNLEIRLLEEKGRKEQELIKKQVYFALHQPFYGDHDQSCIDMSIYDLTNYLTNVEKMCSKYLDKEDIDYVTSSLVEQWRIDVSALGYLVLPITESLDYLDKNMVGRVRNSKSTWGREYFHASEERISGIFKSVQRLIRKIRSISVAHKLYMDSIPELVDVPEEVFVVETPLIRANPDIPELLIIQSQPNTIVGKFVAVIDDDLFLSDLLNSNDAQDNYGCREDLLFEIGHGLSTPLDASSYVFGEINPSEDRIYVQGSRKYGRRLHNIIHGSPDSLKYPNSISEISDEDRVIGSSRIKVKWKLKSVYSQMNPGPVEYEIGAISIMTEWLHLDKSSIRLNIPVRVQIIKGRSTLSDSNYDLRGPVGDQYIHIVLMESINSFDEDVEVIFSSDECGITWFKFSLWCDYAGKTDCSWEPLIVCDGALEHRSIDAINYYHYIGEQFLKGRLPVVKVRYKQYMCNTLHLPTWIKSHLSLREYFKYSSSAPPDYNNTWTTISVERKYLYKQLKLLGMFLRSITFSDGLKINRKSIYFKMLNRFGGTGDFVRSSGLPQFDGPGRYVSNDINLLFNGVAYPEVKKMNDIYGTLLHSVDISKMIDQYPSWDKG